MPPGIGYGDGATGILEGLVGGFLMGHDFRTQRDDRKRRLAQEQQAAMQAAEDRRIAAEARQRSTAIEDVNLRTTHGLAYDPSAPSGAAATPLTRAVQQAYNVPEGFRRVGPSAQDRVTAIRRRVGEFMAADPETQRTMFRDPNVIGGLQEVGFDWDQYISDYAERTTARPLTARVTQGGATVDGVPLADINTVRGQLPPDEAPGGGGGGGTVSERQNTRLGIVASRANAELAQLDTHMVGIPEAVLAGGRGTTGILSGARNWAMAKMAGDDGQRATTAALNFINPVVRYLSGAQMNEGEAARYFRALLPQPGEGQDTVEMKRRMRDIIIEAMGTGQWQAPDSETPDHANVEAAIAEAQALAQQEARSFGPMAGGYRVAPHPENPYR